MTSKWIFIVDNGDGCPRAFTDLKTARKALFGLHQEEYVQDKEQGQPGCQELWVWQPNNEDNYIWKVELK